MIDHFDPTPEHPVALLQACREELMAAQRSVAACLEALERSLESYGALQTSRIFSHLIENGEGALAGGVAIRLDGRMSATLNAAMDLHFDWTERVLCLGRQSIPLTDTEFAIMEILWSRRPQPVSREEIVSLLYKHPARPKTADPFISHIRQKLRLVSGGTEYIEAIRGRGWRLKVPRLAELLPAPTAGPMSGSYASGVSG